MSRMIRIYFGYTIQNSHVQSLSITTTKRHSVWCLQKNIFYHPTIRPRIQRRHKIEKSMTGYDSTNTDFVSTATR